MSSPFPDSVRAFIGANIDSLDQLGALLLLHAHPERRFSLDEVAAALHLPASVVAGRLELLCWRMLLRQDDATVPLYRFAPRDVRLRRAVDLLALACHQRRDEVWQIVASGATASLR
jgi:hypothetical protein